MTQILSVDENNDLMLDANSNLSISVDIQAVLEQCEHVIKVLRGEVVLNTSRGVLGFGQDEIFGNSPNLIKFEARARRALLGVLDVISVDNFSAKLVKNAVEYSATIKTTFGNTPFNGAL